MRRLHCCYPPPIKHKVVTKYVIIMMVASVFMVGFNFLERRSLFLNWNLIWNKFEVWRLITSATTLGPPSMKSVVEILAFHEYSVRLEKDMFNTGGGGGSADYLWMLIVCQALLCLANVFFSDVIFTSKCILLCIVYVWSRKNPNSSASFWGIVVQSQWIPWTIVGIEALMGESFTILMLGIAVGHTYYFLAGILPATHGKILLTTPSFLITWLGDGFQRTGVERYAPPGATAPPGYIETTRNESRGESSSSGLRHRWGGEGRTLGRS